MTENQPEKEPPLASPPTGDGVELVPFSFTESIPADAPVTTTVKYPVRQPRDERNDFFVEVRASVLRKARRKVAQLARGPFPWYEVALAISTTSLGVFLAAVPQGDVKLDSKSIPPLWFLVVAVGLGVAYFFLRVRYVELPSTAATDLLNEIPDPDQALDKEASR